MKSERGFVVADGVRLECEWHRPEGVDETSAPTLVFLHEGLGCVELWRDFPAAVAEACRLPAFVYSRQGYGRSDPCALPRPVSYMHEEGLQSVGAVLRAAGIGRHILVGHSDGASIAIVYAGGTEADGLAGLILEAPHVFTEPGGLASIASAREAYAGGSLKPRLEKYHGSNVDCAFLGWCDAWLHDDFRAWNLEEFLPGIRVPVLVIQGTNDEYGTEAQCRSIERQAGAGAEILMLPDCGHAPHKDKRDATLASMTRFILRAAEQGDAATAV